MKVEKIPTEKVRKPGFLLLDDEGQSIEEVEGYLSYLVACGSSPNTVQAYAYDLLHFYRFLNERSVDWEAFTPALSLDFFEHLSKMPGRNFRVQRLSPVLVSEEVGEEGPATVLSPNSVNRTMACVSSYFGYLIFSGRSVATTNPVQKKPDPALARVPERRKPFLHGIATKRPSSRVTRAKTVLRVPRPLPDGHFEKLLRSLTKLRDRAVFLLMEQGGLRPGEVLCLKLEDVQYGAGDV